MLTFLATVALGAYISQRISIVRDAEIVSVSTDYAQIWNDAIALFALIGSICNWVIALSRLTRAYVDCCLLPWMAERGFKVTIPSIALPVAPAKVTQ